MKISKIKFYNISIIKKLLNGWPVADSWMGEEVYIPRIDRWFEVRV